jgi:hypothetical protein
MSSHSTTDRLATALAFCEALDRDRQQKQIAKELEDKAKPKQQRSINQRPPETLRDHVYIIRASNGYYKIGISFRPHERIKKLPHEVAWAKDLKLVHTIAIRNAYGLEQSLHRHFAAQRVTGEWFLLTEQDVEWLRTQWPSERPANGWGKAS